MSGSWGPTRYLASWDCQLEFLLGELLWVIVWVINGGYCWLVGCCWTLLTSWSSWDPELVANATVGGQLAAPYATAGD